MIFGYFDYLITGVLLTLNLIFWNKRIKRKIGCLIGGILFGLALPFISMSLEIERVTAELEVIDNFTLLYTYFKFPIYWIIGGLQSGLIQYRNKKAADNNV